MTVEARYRRIAEVVGAVARQALADHGCSRVALLDDGGPEARLAARMLGEELGEDAVLLARAGPGELEPLLHLAGWAADPDRAAEELRRLRARLAPGALPAHPASKTALLLGGALPPEPFLPLGDLWASEVEAMEGGCSLPRAARALADAAGGVAALDAALRRLTDRRDPAALDDLPPGAADEVRRALAAGRASRLAPRLVPKVGPRTLCLDLFE